jgi:predicted DNA-binding transcriptional regulator YafY
MTSRLERLIKLDLAIRKGDYPSVDKLCQIVEVQPRTLFADLRELRENLGCDVRYDRQRRGYFNGSPDNKLPTFALTAEELLMIVVAAELLSQSCGQAIAQVLQGALTKIIEGCQEKIDISQSDLKHWFRAGAGEGNGHALRPAQISHILECLKEGKNLLAALPDSEHRETIRPYCLIVFDGQWELVGYLCDKKSIFSHPLATLDLELANDKDGQLIEGMEEELENWVRARLSHFTLETTPARRAGLDG